MLLDTDSLQPAQDTAKYSPRPAEKLIEAPHAGTIDAAAEAGRDAGSDSEKEDSTLITQPREPSSPPPSPGEITRGRLLLLRSPLRRSPVRLPRALPRHFRRRACVLSGLRGARSVSPMRSYSPVHIGEEADDDDVEGPQHEQQLQRSVLKGGGPRKSQRLGGVESGEQCRRLETRGHIMIADGRVLLVFEREGACDEFDTPVACFRAPDTILRIRCRGKTMALGCEGGAVCVLTAPCLQHRGINTVPPTAELELTAQARGRSAVGTTDTPASSGGEVQEV